MTDVEKNAILGNVQRQYVGARYVPKFFQGPDGTPTWVGNVPYEALTIVTYLGNSYTSKIPVPAGIGNPSENPTYWALTGNYNAQVEEYRQAVEEVKNNVLENTSKIEEHGNYILNKQKKPTIILISDSLGGGYTDGSWGRGWYFWIKEYLKESYNVLYPQNSPTVGNRCFSNGTWLADLKFISSTITDENENVKAVVFIGGTNEQNSFNVQNIKNGMAECSAYARNRYPNAQILLCPALAQFNFWYNSLMPVYLNASQQGIGCINTQMLCMNPIYVSSDKTHLTQLGYQTLSAQIGNAILTKKCTFNSQFASADSSWVTLSDGISGSLGRIVFSFNERGVTPFFSGTLVVSNQQVSGTIVLGTVNLPFYFPTNSRMTEISVYYQKEGLLKASYITSTFINSSNQLVANYINNSGETVTTVINAKEIPAFQLLA